MIWASWRRFRYDRKCLFFSRAFITLRSQFHLHHRSQRDLTEIVSKSPLTLDLSFKVSACGRIATPNVKIGLQLTPIRRNTPYFVDRVCLPVNLFQRVDAALVVGLQSRCCSLLLLWDLMSSDIRCYSQGPTNMQAHGCSLRQ